MYCYHYQSVERLGFRVRVMVLGLGLEFLSYNFKVRVSITGLYD